MSGFELVSRVRLTTCIVVPAAETHLQNTVSFAFERQKRLIKKMQRQDTTRPKLQQQSRKEKGLTDNVFRAEIKGSSPWPAQEENISRKQKETEKLILVYKKLHKLRIIYFQPLPLYLAFGWS